MAKPSQSSVVADAFIQQCIAAGFVVTRASGTVVSCKANFQPGDNQRYCELDSAAMSLMDALPTTTPGSIWGSTSDGVGGAVALNRGVYIINRSGVSARVVSAISKSTPKTISA